MRTLKKDLAALGMLMTLGFSGSLWANFECEVEAQVFAENNQATAPAGLYFAEGLCLLQSGDADSGQWAWVKWLYLSPEAELPSHAQSWASVYQAAKEESAVSGVSEIKVLKKQRFGTAQTLFLLEINDPLELLYALHFRGAEGELLLRAAPKMEVALPGLEQSTLVALDRHGQKIREIELTPVMPKARGAGQVAKKSKPLMPWWAWAAIGGVTTVAAGAGFWTWWDSRDDIYLRGRVTVGDAS